MSTVLIVGAGFCGAITAVQMMRMAGREPLHVVLVDRSGAMARGLAYGTDCPDHTLNVPAGNMSAFADDPEHFLRFARRTDSAIGPRSFVARKLYGDYLESLLDAASQSGTGGARLVRVTGDVVHIALGGQGEDACATCADGQRIVAARIVLALGNFPARQPRAGDPGFYASPRYIGDPWNRRAVAAIPPLAPTLLIGTGLSAIDLSLSLLKRNGERTIHALSRRGLLPQSHRLRAAAREPVAPALLQSAGNIRAQLRALRRQASELSSAGGDWREAFNALRPVTGALWHALPVTERRRFLRHVQPYWDSHRHRMAPHAGDVIREAVDASVLRIHAGRLLRFEQTGDGVRVHWRSRRTQAESVLHVSHVINCTGPTTSLHEVDDVLTQQLLADGLIRPDCLGLGLDTAPDCAVVDAWGRASTCLYYVGPLLKARDWEATAVPELRGYAARLARLLRDSR